MTAQRERVEQALAADTLDDPSAEAALDVVVADLLTYLDRNPSTRRAFQDTMIVLDETGRL